MRVLHTTNGDGAANLIKQSSVEGGVLPCRDPMHQGPFPAGLGLDELSERRAAYLAGPGIDLDETVRGFRLRDDHLRSAWSYDEVVLWFEHDLLDQLQILQFLEWFAEMAFDLSNLNLISLDRFEGVQGFRGLGQLSPGQIATLLEARQPVTAEQLELARSGWAAFRSSDPRDLERFSQGNLDALPFLAKALRRLFEEYPGVQDGLTLTERQILKLVAAGASAPRRLFAKNMDLEDALFMGDWSFSRIIADLCRAVEPLLKCEANGAFQYPPGMSIAWEEFVLQRLSLTERGRQVLAGEGDSRAGMEREMRFGGVNVRSGEAMWMGDAKAGHFELAA
jgi:hypothetical protein